MKYSSNYDLFETLIGSPPDGRYMAVSKQRSTVRFDNCQPVNSSVKLSPELNEIMEAVSQAPYTQYTSKGDLIRTAVRDHLGLTEEH